MMTESIEEILLKQFVGAPGAGKTMKALQGVIEQQLKFVYTAPRIELLDDAKAYLENNQCGGVISAIYHDNSASKSVDERIGDFVRRHQEPECKAVLLVTHAALLAANMSQFVGWHLVMDEVPSNAVLTETLHCRASLPAIKELFSLHPAPEGRADLMILRAKQGHVHDILDDPFLRPLTNLWLRARRGTVFIDCAASTDPVSGAVDLWADIARRHCAVVSVWSFGELSPFETVTIAAAGLERSLVHLCCPHEYDSHLVERPISSASIRIHYFDRTTKAGSTFFASKEGEENLARIGAHLRALKEPLGYWTCNLAVREKLLSLMPGGYVCPMQEGSNRLRSSTSCAAFYSAKKTPSDRLLCRAYDLSSEDIERAREWEHLAQFVMRGKPRDHDYDGKYDVYVYDVLQAERLASYLRLIGFPDTEVKFVELEGMQGRKLQKKGRRAIYTMEEALERKRARDRLAYARRKAQR